MSSQPPPQIMNPGESQMPAYGQQPVGNHGGQFPPPPHHPSMMQMGPGGPYPPYMMFPMGGPFYMHPMHADMQGDLHFQQQPPMMQMPLYGYPPHGMMAPPSMQSHHHLNPNVAKFVPSAKQASPSETPTPEEPPAVAKPTSRRLRITDPVTGEEISIEPAAASKPVAPPTALISADVVFGSNGAPTRPGLIVATPPPPPAVEEAPAAEVVVRKPPALNGGGMKLKNAVLVKPPVLPPKPEEKEKDDQVVLAQSGTRKMLKGIKNVALKREPPAVTTSPVSKQVPPSGRFKLTNKALGAPSASSSSSSALSQEVVFPISREVFLKYLSFARPDRHAPSSINVFPSELLGLRTAFHGDPGLSLNRSSGGGAGRRLVLQKTVSQVSMGSARDWRGKSGRMAGGQQQNVRGAGRMGGKSSFSAVPQIIRPSERGFKVIDQSSLSEKDKLRRQVMSQLNKITVDSFKQITNQIAEIEISLPWQMDVVIGLIFDKAVVEHSYSEMYAEMCKKLRNTWPELTGVDQETGQSVPVTFSRAIIEKCQTEFDNMPDSLEATPQDLEKVKGNLEDLEMLLQKRKERILGNMKFIAQLFLMGILSSRVIRSVVNQLLFRVDAPEEHYIECVGTLLHNIGSILMETESGRAYVTQFVARMKNLTARDEYGKRIKFMMKDVIDAAQAGWAGKHAGARLVSAAKSKEAVRRDAQVELEKKKTNTPNNVYGDSYYHQQRSARGGSSNNFKPTSVLQRAAVKPAAATSAVISSSKKVAEEWSSEEDEEEDQHSDEVSEYAASSSSGDDDDESESPHESSSSEEAEEIEDDGEGEFTTVARH